MLGNERAKILIYDRKIEKMSGIITDVNQCTEKAREHGVLPPANIEE